jgi:hypothetical protein
VEVGRKQNLLRYNLMKEERMKNTSKQHKIISLKLPMRLAIYSIFFAKHHHRAQLQLYKIEAVFDEIQHLLI